MEQIVTGLVLSKTDYKERDGIINVLTEEGELIAFYASGIKKITSKNAIGCQPFAISEFTYFNNKKSLKRLKSAKIIDNLGSIYQDYDLLISAFIILDLTAQLCRNQEASKILYDETIALLKNIDENNKDILISYYLNQVLMQLGTVLVSDFCSLCHCPTVHGISLKHGGFVCHQCVDHFSYALTTNELRLFRLICKLPLSEILKLEYSQKEANKLIIVFYDFFQEYSGLYSKTLNDYIKKIR